jgi:hypothetical protein
MSTVSTSAETRKGGEPTGKIEEFNRAGFPKGAIETMRNSRFNIDLNELIAIGNQFKEKLRDFWDSYDDSTLVNELIRADILTIDQFDDSVAQEIIGTTERALEDTKGLLWAVRVGVSWLDSYVYSIDDEPTAAVDPDDTDDIVTCWNRVIPVDGPCLTDHALLNDPERLRAMVALGKAAEKLLGRSDEEPTATSVGEPIVVATASTRDNHAELVRRYQKLLADAEQILADAEHLEAALYSDPLNDAPSEPQNEEEHNEMLYNVGIAVEQLRDGHHSL